MDYLFQELIGKPSLNPPKIITVIAENFSLLEDQARFLKATLAIPIVKQLPFNNISQRLIQIGPLQREIADQVRRDKWALNQYEDFEESICERIEADLSELRNRSIIFVNDVSKIELASFNPGETKKLLRLADKLRGMYGHFVVLLYQGSEPNSTTSFIRDMEFMSDAVARVKSCKAGYFKNIWWQTIPQHKTLIPAKIETNYYTCKIGKNYYSSDLLCFYERRKVSKNYDLENDTCLSDRDESDNEAKDKNDRDDLRDLLSATRLDLVPDDDEDDVTNTLPYTQAQNPEQSRIFYYPDKDDDIDEDDPDNDLGI